MKESSIGKIHTLEMILKKILKAYFCNAKFLYSNIMVILF